ncbi:MAG: SpoIID/LytB domain-containing protein [bacterium]|nr:SpoIID/LytB domain-containing protein [Candidatus Sumerlaeota bacterium]
MAVVPALLAVCLIVSSVQPQAAVRNKQDRAVTDITGGKRVRILLKSGCSSISAFVNGTAGIVCDGVAVANGVFAGDIRANGSSGGIEAIIQGKRYHGTSALVVIATSGDPVACFQISSKRYRGSLVLQSRRGGFDVINDLDIDDWLKGVLPAEIGASSPVEALKAQAVAARSEAVHKLARPPHAAEGYDFCTGVHCQAYKGMTDEGTISNAAVDGTRGIVLTVNGQVIDAVYHNVCGGATSSADDVWDGPPEPGIVPVFDSRSARGAPNLASDEAMARFINDASMDIFCNSSQPGYPNYAKKYFRWQKTLSAAELERVCGVGRVRDVVVTERRASGRVRKLRIEGERGSRTVEKELPIRNMFNLWSGLFVVRVLRSGNTVQSATFTGAGNGHGAGLCQMGARTMGFMGYSFTDILGHYYRGTRLERVY